MHVHLRCTITVLVVGLSTGCATVRPTGSASMEDPYAAVRAEVSDRPPVPSAEQLMPSVELVTFPSEAEGAAGRDTVRGREEVAGWLDDMVDRTRGDWVRFRLQTADVMVCQGAAVERGHYPIPQASADQLGRTEEYLALWRPRGDDWQLERLWLAPSDSLKMRDLAEDCVRKPWGLSLGAAFSVGHASDLAAVADAVSPRYEEVAYTEGAIQPGLQAWASIRALPWLSGQLRYAYRSHPELHARNILSTTGEVFEEFSLKVRAHHLSVVAEARFGPMGLAIGPMLIETRAETTYPDALPSWLFVRVGGEVRAFGVVRLSRSFRASFSAGYRYVPKIYISPLIGAREDAYLNMGGPDLTIGLELVL